MQLPSQPNPCTPAIIHSDGYVCLPAVQLAARIDQLMQQITSLQAEKTRLSTAAAVDKEQAVAAATAAATAAARSQLEYYRNRQQCVYVYKRDDSVEDMLRADISTLQEQYMQLEVSGQGLC